MPHQAMPDDEHSVILAELNEFVCQAKVISVFFRTFLQHFDELTTADDIDTAGYGIGLCHQRLFFKFFKG